MLCAREHRQRGLRGRGGERLPQHMQRDRAPGPPPRLAMVPRECAWRRRGRPWDQDHRDRRAAGKIDRAVDRGINLARSRNLTAMQPIARRASAHGSDPPSGVRPRRVDIDRLARRHLARAGRWARELGVPEQDVEELLQEALLVVVKKAGPVRPELLESWFRGVLWNRKRHLLRAKAIARKFEPLLQAHIEHSAPPAPTSDADLLRRQAISAALWLLSQVHPSRRQVVERHLFDDEPLAEIAESMNLRPGTVFARWERGKADMRAAIERAQKKEGSARWLVALAALIEALWLGFLAKARPLGERVASLSGRTFGRARGRASRRDALASSGRSRPRSFRSRAWAVAAWAVFPLAFISHGALRAPVFPAVLAGASLGATAAFLEREALDEEPAAPGPTQPVVPRLPATSNDRRSPAATPGQAPRTAARPAAGRSPPSAADLEMARILLLQATTSTNHDVARAALRRYRRMFPDNPYPALYERARQAEQGH